MFSGQGNNLVAYDSTAPFESQVVITNAADDPENGRDINAQICFWDDPELGRLFIAGEDTGQPDPPPGWGIFRLDGSAVGELAATQIGKLTPTYQPGEQAREPRVRAAVRRPHGHHRHRQPGRRRRAPAS